MTEFTDQEKERLLQVLEDIAQTNREIVFYLAVSTSEVVNAAFERAFADEHESLVYRAVNGSLSIRAIAGVVGISKSAVQRKIERLAGKGFVEKNEEGRYQKALSQLEIVQRYSGPGKG